MSARAPDRQSDPAVRRQHEKRRAFL